MRTYKETVTSYEVRDDNGDIIDSGSSTTFTCSTEELLTQLLAYIKIAWGPHNQEGE